MDNPRRGLGPHLRPSFGERAGHLSADLVHQHGFNFPLNLVTTVAELYIGFLVGASSNRSERNLEATLGRMSAQSEQIKAQEAQINDVEANLSAGLAQNTKLTQAVHELTQAIHASICDKNDGNVS